MRVCFSTSAIVENIRRAEKMADRPISLMFKDFYEDVHNHLSINNKVFSLHIKGSVCYSIGKATRAHKGALVTSAEQASACIEKNIRDFYIPINAKDNREGLCVSDARELAGWVGKFTLNNVYGLITSGCLNSIHPEYEEMVDIWRGMNGTVKSVSLGGSFWLGQDLVLPDFVSDIRIGEYMLFGTIPYYEGKSKNGEMGVIIEAEVVGLYPERRQMLVDCGYSMADIEKCQLKEPSLRYIDSSSEYSILEGDIQRFKVGDKIRFIPNYKSLVKLRYVERRYQ